MRISEQIECPVNLKRVNENKVRIIALQVFAISTAYLFTGYWPLIAFLIVDFFIRAFEWERFSILSLIASLVVKFLGIKNKSIDQAPKLFAARVGIIFSLGSLAFHTGFPGTAFILALTLCVFSFLESFVGFCAGCYVYSIGKKLFPSSY